MIYNFNDLFNFESGPFQENLIRNIFPAILQNVFIRQKKFIINLQNIIIYEIKH